MIDKFPNFSKLSLAEQAEVYRYTQLFPSFSDFNFTSLFVWNNDDSAELSILNDNLVIRLPDYLDGHPVYSILGTNKVDESVNELLKLTDKLEMVPEITVQSLREPGLFELLEDRDNFDYIFDLAHLSKLPGDKFKKKRNKANVFTRDHNHLKLEIKTVEALDDTTRQSVHQVDKEWATSNPRSKGDTAAEHNALKRLLDNASHFQLVTVLLIVDGQIKAFSINEVISHDTVLCHFEKALVTHHIHTNTFLIREAAKELHARGSKYINWEQDLGLDGLRRSKSSYHPVRFLKKYTVKASSRTA